MKRHQYKHIRDKKRMEQIDAEQRGRKDQSYSETHKESVTYPEQ